MDTHELDYELPKELIAQTPAAERTQSRLLTMERKSGRIDHYGFTRIAQLLQPGDCLVINDSRVIPARFFARRATGGLLEGLFLRQNEDGIWQAMLKRASRLRPGELILLCRRTEPQTGDEIAFRVMGRQGRGIWRLQPQTPQHYLEILRHYGTTPLPPYIRRDVPDDEHDLTDQQRYQTVYACRPGSVAAPTAGLHFDRTLLERLAAKGVRLARLRLHVGLGTFEPVVAEKIEDHPMHDEEYELEPFHAEIINQTRQQQGRIVAVGTTVVRTLETLAEHGRVRPGAGQTRLLITPGYSFQIVDALLTNFHLPRTTLLALVCAFAGTRLVLAAYREAIEKQYRFYSYGDAMFIY